MPPSHSSENVLACPHCGARGDTTWVNCAACGKPMKRSWWARLFGGDKTWQGPASRTRAEAFIQSGDLIAAVREVRRLGGQGLKESMLAVDFYRKHGHWEPAGFAHGDEPATAPHGAEHLGHSPGGLSLVGDTVLDAEQVETVLAALADGQKIQAVKQVRLWTNLGLKEAKEIVDSMEAGR